MKKQAFAKAIRTASVAALLAFAFSGPAAYAQFAQREDAVPRVSVDRAFLIGRWTDAHDCHESGQFTADGRYTNTAGQTAAWTLEGVRLTLTFQGAPARTLRVSAADQNTLNVINPDGSTGHSTRC